jgi:hypothetical protein
MLYKNLQYLSTNHVKLPLEIYFAKPGKKDKTRISGVQ